MAPRDDRVLLRLALRAAFRHLEGDPAGLGLAHVLAAAHQAFFGDGDPKAARMLAGAAAKVLTSAQRDASGAASYAADGFLVPLGMGPNARPVDRARYIRARVEKALAAGFSATAVARDVAAAVEHAWPVPHDAAAKIVRDERVRTAIDKAHPEATVKAALRAAGVAVSRNLFAADDQKTRRSKL